MISFPGLRTRLLGGIVHLGLVAYVAFECRGSDLLVLQLLCCSAGTLIIDVSHDDSRPLLAQTLRTCVANALRSTCAGS